MLKQEYKPKIFSFVLIYVAMIFLLPFVFCKDNNINITIFVTVFSFDMIIFYLLYLFYKKYASYIFEIKYDKLILRNSYNNQTNIIFSNCKIYEAFLVYEDSIIFLGYKYRIYDSGLMNFLENRIEYARIANFKQNLFLIKKLKFLHPLFIIFITFLYFGIIIFLCS